MSTPISDRPFIHSYDDPTRKFEAREAASESRRAAALSQAEGRAVDAFGFAEQNGGLAFDPTSPGAPPRVIMPHTVLDAKTRLWIARTIAAERRRGEEAAAEMQRQLIEEFEIPAAREIQTMSEKFPDLYQELFDGR